MSTQINPFITLPSSRLFPISDIALSISESTEDTLVEVAKTAYIAFHVGDFQCAKEIYDLAIEEVPEIPFFYACRSLINTALGDDEGAFYDYQIAKTLDFNYHSFLDWVEQAIAPSAVELSYANQTSCLNDALEAVQEFDYVQALAIYDYALRTYGNQAELLTFRGAVYVNLLQYEQALADFSEAIACDKTYFQAYLFRAKLYAAVMDEASAVADFDQAVALNPSSSAVYEERGNYRLKTGQPQLALIDFNKLVELAPDDFYVFALRADLHEYLENWPEALADLDRAIAINPYYSDLYQYRAAVKVQLGDFAGALVDETKFEELEADEH